MENVNQIIGMFCCITIEMLMIISLCHNGYAGMCFSAQFSTTEAHTFAFCLEWKLSLKRITLYISVALRQRNTIFASGNYMKFKEKSFYSLIRLEYYCATHRFEQHTWNWFILTEYSIYLMYRKHIVHQHFAVLKYDCDVKLRTKHNATTTKKNYAANSNNQNSQQQKKWQLYNSYNQQQLTYIHDCLSFFSPLFSRSFMFHLILVVIEATRPYCYYNCRYFCWWTFLLSCAGQRCNKSSAEQ